MVSSVMVSSVVEHQERGPVRDARNRRRDDPLRVVVGDGDALSRAGMSSLLDSRGVEVVGEAADADTLLDLVAAQHPALVVIDATLQETAAGRCDPAVAVRERHPEVGVVLLATRIEIEPAATLLMAGSGIGYLARSHVRDADDFVETLDRVARGETVADPGLVQAMVEAQRHEDPLEALSPRERDVLTEMARGRSNYGIARALWVAPATVEKHVRSILIKLCLPDGPTDHRRVLAVLAYLGAGQSAQEWR